MFNVKKSVLNKIKEALAAQPELAPVGPNIKYGCSSCTGSCKLSCRGDCKGSCKGSCTRSCQGHSR